MLSPPSEPFGLRLPLRMRWSFRIASASWRGIGVCRRPRVVAERSSTTTSSDAALALPSRGGRAVSSCMVCTLWDGGRPCSPTTEVNSAPRCRSDRRDEPLEKGESETEGLRRGGRLSPRRCPKGDRRAGSAVFLVSWWSSSSSSFHIERITTDPDLQRRSPASRSALTPSKKFGSKISAPDHSGVR